MHAPKLGKSHGPESFTYLFVLKTKGDWPEGASGVWVEMPILLPSSLPSAHVCLTSYPNRGTRPYSSGSKRQGCHPDGPGMGHQAKEGYSQALTSDEIFYARFLTCLGPVTLFNLFLLEGECLPYHCIFEAGDLFSAFTSTLRYFCVGYAPKTQKNFLLDLMTGFPTLGCTVETDSGLNVKSEMWERYLLSWCTKDKILTPAIDFLCKIHEISFSELQYLQLKT